MTTNTKIRTEDVLEILDTKIKTSAAHAQLDVLSGEFYDSVLAKIAARSPTLDEKGALDNAISPSASNPFVTLAEMTTALAGAIPWRTIGPLGSGADFEGLDETPFNIAFLTSHDTYVFTVMSANTTVGTTYTHNGNTFTILTSITNGDSLYCNGSGAPLTSGVLTKVSGIGDNTITFSTYTIGNTNSWFYVKPATYEFTVPVTVPDGVRLVGSVTSATILASDTGDTLIVGQDTYIGFLTILTSTISATAVVATSSINVEFKNCIIASPSASTTIEATGASYLTLTDCAFFFGNIVGTGLSTSTMAYCYVEASGTYGVDLISPIDTMIWGNVFYAGTPQVTSGTNIRIVGNHFNNGVTNITPISSVVMRANTPSSNNNEDESLTYLLQYLGSPGALQNTPSYSSNFTGPQAQDLTARASAIDLCLQWIYEERNFSLIAETEPMTVSWDPVAMTLTTTGRMLLVSAHRDAVWKLPIISSTNIQDGWFLYYIIDRSLATSDITLTPYLAPLGSIPIDTIPPTGSTNNRQIYTLAYNLGGTLWWRGGGGSRFPSTGGYTGEYFVDGSSKSLLTYLGANDYNDPHPAYSNNFAGIQGESLTTRLGKTDTLLKRLFEHSNLSYYISTGGYFSSDATGVLVLTGTLTFKLPHTSGSITVSANSWTIADGSILYFTWDQVALGAASSTIATTVLLPDAYPLTTKYFVAALRVGSFFYLWDGTRIPMNGGRWPLPSPGRDVVPTAAATTLMTTYGNTTNNTVWTTISTVKHFLWENLALMTSTGTTLTRNALANQLTPSTGLTNLADGEGLMITHTWNSGAAQNVTIAKVALPLTSILEQNQFLWVQNHGGYLLFTGES